MLRRPGLGRLGLSQDSGGTLAVDPTLLFAGLGLLALALLLSGGRPRRAARATSRAIRRRTTRTSTRRMPAGRAEYKRAEFAGYDDDPGYAARRRAHKEAADLRRDF